VENYTRLAKTHTLPVKEGSSWCSYWRPAGVCSCGPWLGVEPRLWWDVLFPLLHIIFPTSNGLLAFNFSAVWFSQGWQRLFMLSLFWRTKGENRDNVMLLFHQHLGDAALPLVGSLG